MENPVRCLANFKAMIEYNNSDCNADKLKQRDLGRVSKLPTPAPLGSLDTLPRSRSLLQTKMAAAPSKLTSEQSTRF